MDAAQQYILIYMSRFTGTSSEVTETLKQINHLSRRNNKKTDITGLLFYQNGKFLQILEGEADRLTTLYEKLKKDSRHTDLCLIEYCPIVRKSLTGWHLDTFDLSSSKDIKLKELETFNLQFKHNCQMDSQLFVATLKDRLQQKQCVEING